MRPTKAIVLIVDGLGTACVGPYGNTWVPTPTFNRLAAKSVLVENAFIDSPHLESVYRSYWQGVHAFCPSSEAISARSLPCDLQNSNVPCTVVTDEMRIADHFLSGDFSEIVRINPKGSMESASDVADTHFAQLLAQSTHYLRNGGPSSLLWIHARGLTGPWDAPLELRRALADEEGPVPPDVVQPPHLLLEEDVDPDVVLGLVHAYAGQVQCIDMCLSAFFSSVEGMATECDILFLVTAARGFALGEHRRVGVYDSLHGELLQIPCLMWFSDGRGATDRIQSLWQPPCLFATLSQWFGVPDHDAGKYGAESYLPSNESGVIGASSSRACSLSTTERSIRTPAWFYRERNDVATAESVADTAYTDKAYSADSIDPTRAQQLYVKPDDRWESNEVSQRCPSIVELLEDELNRFEQAANAAALDSLPALHPDLCRRID